ncbi:MAG: tol-pal system protein YbgF [Pseudomonadota bacterium]
MIRFALCLSLFLVAGPALTQDRDQTLADIRQELNILFVEIQRLKRELSTTGAPHLQLGGTGALERIDSMERELQRLTAATEELTNRVERIVQDGTNRIGDLEFRLVELEGGDISQLGETTTLGGEPALPGLGQLAGAEATPESAPSAPAAQLAVSEQSDFDRAKAAFDAGDFNDAAIQFETFTETYIGGPLSGQAHFWRGEALTAIGNPAGAARAFLESFSGDPDSVVAPDALLRLGQSLETLGQIEESCVMLEQVTVRFPTSNASLEAQAARASLGCV